MYHVDFGTLYPHVQHLMQHFIEIGHTQGDILEMLSMAHFIDAEILKVLDDDEM